MSLIILLKKINIIYFKKRIKPLYLRVEKENP